MTANNPLYWRNGNYRQPLVNNPPWGQRANNARMAVWHFSRKFAVEMYPAGSWRKEDGRYDRGQARIVEIWGSIQPNSGVNKIRENLPEGESFEGQLIIHVDSHQPENIEIALANPDLFPDGVFLAGVGQNAFFDTRGFGMIVQFRNLRWRIQDVDVYENAGDEEVALVSAVHRGRCTLFTDVQQEMQADLSGEVIAP